MVIWPLGSMRISAPGSPDTFRLMDATSNDRPGSGPAVGDCAHAGSDMARRAIAAPPLRYIS
jgi:hypothetical protein